MNNRSRVSSLIIKIVLSASIVTMFAIAAGLRINRSSQTADTTLIVGMMGGWAPFMTINAQGGYEGFDVDVATELAKRMGKQLVIKDFGSVASCLIAVEQNKANMVFSGLDITESRLKKFIMVPYAGQTITSIALVFWNSIPAGVHSMENLRTLSACTICTDPGSSQEKYLDQFNFITKKPMASVADMVLDLRYGKSTAAILEPFLAQRIKRKNPEAQILEMPLPLEFQQFGFGIAIKKNNTILEQITTTIIKEMRQDGTLTALEKKWQLEE